MLISEVHVEILRATIGFFTLLILTRLLGKQQVSELTVFDYILGITIGSTASSLTTDLTSGALPHWAGLVTWVGFAFLMQVVSVKWRKASRLVDGVPSVVIMNGMIMEDAMRKMRYTVSDLLEQLRSKDVFDIKQVEFAVLERNGQISVLKKSQYQPATPKDLNLSTGYDGLQTVIIYDGTVLEQNLKHLNLDRIWSQSELSKHGVNEISEVLLASLDTQGVLYVDKYKDHLVKLTDLSD